MTSKYSKCKWNKEFQSIFDTIKKLVSRKNAVSCTNFNEPFDIHKDANKIQLGSVIGQNGNSIKTYT